MEPYIGEVRMFGGTFAPDGWAMCDGRLLSIANFEALYALLGTTYGGDGVNTFAVPDLRGRVPLHKSFTMPVGQLGGVESVLLQSMEMGEHTHVPMAQSANGTLAAPGQHYWGANAESTTYSTAVPSDTFDSGAIGVAGRSQPHENMMPYQVLTFIIAVQGVYPAPA